MAAPDAEACAAVAPAASPVLTWLRSRRGRQAPITTAHVTRSGLIEVVLPGGASVRVDAGVNERALRRVFAALRG